MTSNNNTVQDLQNMWFLALAVSERLENISLSFFFFSDLLISPKVKVVVCRCDDHTIVFSSYCF